MLSGMAKIVVRRMEMENDRCIVHAVSNDLFFFLEKRDGAGLLE